MKNNDSISRKAQTILVCLEQQQHLSKAKYTRRLYEELSGAQTKVFDIMADKVAQAHGFQTRVKRNLEEVGSWINTVRRNKLKKQITESMIKVEVPFCLILPEYSSCPEKGQLEIKLQKDCSHSTVKIKRMFDSFVYASAVIPEIHGKTIQE